MFFKTQEQRRITVYIVLFITLFLSYFLLRDLTWQGNKQFHTILETIAAVLAFIIGTMTLVRFYTKKNNTFLFISIGFLGAGWLDASHAFITSTFFNIYFPSLPQELIAWSWITSRLFLSILLWFSWLAWRREERLGKAGKFAEKTVYLSVTLLTIASIIFFTFVPHHDFPEWFFHHPDELIPALFFILALIGYLRKGHWKNNNVENNFFDHWLIISIIVGFMGQVMFISVASHSFDMMSSIAHILKQVSYLCVLIGLMINMHQIFKHSEKIAEQSDKFANKLSASYAQLQREIVVREQAENKAQQAKEAAEIANYAKSEFLTNMSHELKTPLNGILGFAQILKRDKTLGSQQLDAISIIEKSGEHLLVLLNDILDMAKIEAKKIALNPTNFHLKTFLNSIVEIIQIRAQQKGITFIHEFQSDLTIAVNCDETRLRQILIHLLNNAVKFSDVGQVTFKVMLHQNKIRFQVEDTGYGIAPEHLKVIFEPFQQFGTRNTKAEGTGLGLPISKKLVEIIGGTLNVKSTLGKGSVFWFDLVLAPAHGWQPAKKLPKQSIKGFKGNPRRILVVDDSKTNRAVFNRLLSPLGFEILEALNGQQAVEKALAERPDLILIDLLMPVMGGLEATRQIRQTAKMTDVVIIVASGNNLKHNQEESLSAGGNDFIAKPINTDDLLEKLHKHLKLEWVFDNDSHESLQTATQSDQPMVGPPPDVAKTLFQLAMQGNVDGIIKHSAQLEKTDDKFKPFATKLQQLAKEFKVRKIRELIKPYLK